VKDEKGELHTRVDDVCKWLKRHNKKIDKLEDDLGRLEIKIGLLSEMFRKIESKQEEVKKEVEKIDNQLAPIAQMPLRWERKE